MFKVITFVALVAAAHAGYLGPAAHAGYLGPAAHAGYLGPAAHAGYLGPAAAPLLRAPLAAAPLFRAAAPIAAAPIAKVAVAEQYDPNPQYSFGYDVQDGLTGDSKNHYETRDGEVVRGSYSLNDPDGTRRIVEYVADWVNGFNAVVRKEPLVVAAPAPVAAAPLLHSKALFH